MSQTKPLTGTIFGAGMLAGGLALGVLSSTTSLVPNYLRDNLALFRIGAMWIGDLEGATLAMALSQDWGSTFLGGLGGLTTGAVAGWWLDRRSPNYGRVALIQSAALFGAALGAVAVPAAGMYPTDPRVRDTTLTDNSTEVNHYRSQIKERLAWGMLAGLNTGLVAGLSMAYLPDQRSYGPSWQRVIMVDLAGLAGALLGSAVEVCSRPNKSDIESYCANANVDLNDRTARFALIGGGIGLVTGWLLTTNYDQVNEARPTRSVLSYLPMPSAVPIQSKTGSAELVPGLVSQGSF